MKLLNFDAYRSVLFIFFFLFLMICGCGGDEDPTDIVKAPVKNSNSEAIIGGTYRIPLVKNPAGLDPANLRDRYSLYVANQIFEGLVQFGPYLSIMPAMAANWSVGADGKKITFILRSDAFFHHGRRVKAKDAIYTLERLLRVEPAPAILTHLLKIKGAQSYRDRLTQHVSGLMEMDETSLTISLTESYAPFLSALAMYQAAIVPKDIVEQNESNFGEFPIGSGPFQFVSWQPDQFIRLERFTQYYGGSSFLDTIEYRVFPDAQIDDVIEAFKLGEIEEMPVYGTVRAELSNLKNLKWVRRPSLSLLFYGINTNQTQLKDPRFRRALSEAIDRKKLVETVYNGQFEPAYAVVPPGMPAHTREDVLVNEKLTEARKDLNDLAKTVLTNEPVIEIASTSQSNFAQAEFRFISDAWAKIGVKCKVKYITDWNEFERYLKSDDLYLYRFSWTADMPDPDNFLQPLFGSDSQVNYTRYSDPEIDKLLKQAGELIDPIDRARLYQIIEKQVMISHPIIPLFYLSFDRVYQPNVHNVHISALGPHTTKLHRVWLSP